MSNIHYSFFPGAITFYLELSETDAVWHVPLIGFIRTQNSQLLCKTSCMTKRSGDPT
jgi:hypothetical protein